MQKYLVLLLLLVSYTTHSFSQGTFRGKITDEHGEALIGATIMVKTATITGTVTDFDGNFSIKINSENPQPILISYVGFTSMEDTVNPRNGEVLVKNYEMLTISNEIGEITITAKAVKGKESYMEKVKISSASFIDFISTETIKRTGDSNVSSAVSRITGVSTYGGFITVRGIGDRYIKTTVNGLRIPTLDPLTNNIKLDLFPSSLVDNIIINKTFNADLPGDWAGAYLSIETRDYPDKLTLNIETTFGFNNQSTFKTIISSERSATDWLGFDSGFRNIEHQPPAYYDPGLFKYQEFAGAGLETYLNSIGVDEKTPWDVNDYSSIYTRLSLVELGFLEKALFYDKDAVAKAVADYNGSDLKQQALFEATKDVVRMGQSLPNTWQPVYITAPMDFSQSFSIGNQTTFLQKQIGYLFGLRYSKSSLYDGNSSFGRSDVSASLGTDVSDVYKLYTTFGPGKSGIESNGWSALLNLSVKLNPNNSISILFMPNIQGTNRARQDFVYSSKTGSPVTYYTELQNYESRRQLVYELKTEHFIPASKMKVSFNASYTDGMSNSPDFRQINYLTDGSGKPVTLYWTSQESGNFRIFRGLSEDLFDSNISAELPLGNIPSLPRKLKFGAAYQRLIRKSDQRFYILPTECMQAPVNGDLESYLSLEKFGFSGGTVERYYDQLSGDENNTIGFSNITAGFATADYTIIAPVRLSAGIRIEDSHMHTDIADYYYKLYATNDDRRQGVKPALRDRTFLLPGAGIVYHINRDKTSPINLRINYSRTTALPSLRELTPFRVYDYTLLGVVTGNSNLKPVIIDNYDIRFESFFRSGNNISVSIFSKKFTNHIEMIREDLDEVYYSWQNTDKSSVLGIELEGRVGITKNLEFRANTTLVDSKTQLVNDTVPRAMFGQAPFVINTLLSYSSDKAGIEASISYNVQGPRLVITKTYDEADVYELTRHIIDAKLTKRLGKHFIMSFRARDLLNSPIVRAYKFPDGWLDFDRYAFGTTFLLGVIYNLN